MIGSTLLYLKKVHNWHFVSAKHVTVYTGGILDAFKVSRQSHGMQRFKLLFESTKLLHIICILPCAVLVPKVAGTGGLNIP